MSDSNAVSPPAERGFLASSLIRNTPYIILLILALIGVAYTDFSPARSSLYWQVMVPLFALLCIIARWRRVEPNTRSRLRMIWDQVLHWGALLLVMRLLFVPEVRNLLDSDITGMLLLYLVALTTFLGGIYLDWRLCIVGVFLGLGAIAIAFLDEVALPMLGLAMLTIVVFILWTRFRRKTDSSDAPRQSVTEPVRPEEQGNPERTPVQDPEQENKD